MVAASDTIEALRAQVNERDALVASLELQLQMAREEAEQAAADKDDAIGVYAAQSEQLEALLVSGAKAYKVGDAMYTYTEEGGRVTLTGYIGREQKVSVPSEIDGMPVVCIGRETFKETAVREIIVPTTVTRIDWFAFYGCFGLGRVVLPASVTDMEYGVFEGCSSSLTVYCPAGSYAERYAKSYGIPTMNG